MTESNNLFLKFQSKITPYTLLILVILIWGTSSGFVKLFTQEGMSFKGIVLLSGIIVFISFLTATFLQGVKSLLDIFKNYQLRELKKLVAMGMLAFFLYPICYFYGISGSSPCNANVLNYLWPAVAFIVAATITDRQQITLMNTIAISMAFIGASIAMMKGVSIEQGNGNLFQLLCALLGGIAYGIYSALINRSVPKSKSGEPMPSFYRMTTMLFFCSVVHVLILVYFIVFDKSIAYLTYSSVFNVRDWRIYFVLLYAGLNFTLAHYWWNDVNGKLPVHVTSVTAYVIPVISTLFLFIVNSGFNVLHMDFSLVLSLGFVICAPVIANWKERPYVPTSCCAFILIGCLLLFEARQDVSQEYLTFLQIIVATFAIYYGFLINRIRQDRKDVEHVIDALHRQKYTFDHDKLEALKGIEKKLDDYWKKSPENIAKEIIKIGLFTPDEQDFLIQSYTKIIRHSFYHTNMAEWFILSSLSVAMLILCFHVKSDAYVSTLMCCIIIFSISLMLAALKRVDCDKRVAIKLLNNEVD